jgi:hypothetical protein
MVTHEGGKLLLPPSWIEANPAACSATDGSPDQRYVDLIQPHEVLVAAVGEPSVTDAVVV